MMAPVAGCWIVSNPNLGWRWCEWVTLIISGATLLIALLFLPETYLPILPDWKAEHLRRVSGSQNYVSKHAQSAPSSKRLKAVLPMPITFLSNEPVIAVLGGYLVLLYIILFSFLSGLGTDFPTAWLAPTSLPSRLARQHLHSAPRPSTVGHVGQPAASRVLRLRESSDYGQRL